MANHTVPHGGTGTAEFTLTAGVVDTVTFTDNDVAVVEVISCAGTTDAVWWTTGDADDIVTPTLDGDERCFSWYNPGLPCSNDREARSARETVVKLISAGTPNIRVQRKGY